jgi:type IV pilus assembly protein PilN
VKHLDPIPLNLASQPFRKERAQLTGFVILCVLLTCTLLMLCGLIMKSRTQAADLRRRIDADSAKLRTLRLEQSKFSSVLAKPQNADVFSDSVFLNQLIARRGLSWSRAFRDLEEVLPPDIKLLAIRLPQVGEEDSDGVNRVQLDMVVGAIKPQSFMVLVKRLQDSKEFGSMSMTSQTPPAQNDPYYKYRLTVAYAQKL